MNEKRSEAVLDQLAAELKAYGDQAMRDGITTYDREDRTALYEAMGRLHAANHLYALLTRLRGAQEPQSVPEACFHNYQHVTFGHGYTRDECSKCGATR